MEFQITNLLLVMFIAWVAGQIAGRVGYPAVLGELVAGLLLGPPLLGLIHGSEALGVLAEIGVLLMMLYIGMEIHPEQMFKASWGGILAALGGFVTPFVGGYYVTLLFGGEPLAGLFIGIAVGITSLATKSRILVDLKLLGTRVAHILMAGALFSDTAALVVFAGIMGVVDIGVVDIATISLVAGKALLFFIVTGLVGWRVLPLLTSRMTQAGYTDRTLNATLILMIALFFGALAELAGLHSILGAFIAGLFLREGMLERRLFNDISKLVHDVSIGFLAPIFFVTAGFEITFDVFTEAPGFLAAVVAVAMIGKVVGTALFYLPSGNGWREGVTVGVGMNGRGAVEIIIAGIGLQMGIIDDTIFSILVFMAIFTTATVPLLLTYTVNWLRSRDELVHAGEPRDSVILVGAGATARLLAERLGRYHPVWLIDSNRHRCQAARSEGLNAVCGDAKSEESLAQAHAERAQTLIAMSPSAETNVIAAEIAFLVYDVPEIYVLIDERVTRGMSKILTDIGAKDICSAYPADIEEWDYSALEGSAEVVEKPITEPMSLSSLVAKSGSQRMLPLLVLQKDEITLPCSVLEVEPGDVVVALERASAPAEGAQ